MPKDSTPEIYFEEKEKVIDDKKEKEKRIATSYYSWKKLTTGTESDVVLVPMKSAYKERKGEEPKFTNWAQTEGATEAFKDTLDYIFTSSEWKVSDVKPMPLEDEVNGPCPRENEPSDHMLLNAQLFLS